MRKSICTMIFTLIFALSAGGFELEDKAVITGLYHDMYRAMISKDSTALTEILDDKFVLVHMTGKRQAKTEYINAILDGTLNYYSEEADEISIEITADKARLTGKSRVNAAVFGGGRHTWRLQLDIDLIKHDRKWIMTHALASTY